MKILKALVAYSLFLFISISCEKEDQFFSKKRTLKIFLIGDSTCSDYALDRFPLTGWGTHFKKITNKNEVINRAISGTSSKSFYNDPMAWQKTFIEIKENDYVFIQFGHNDQRTDESVNTSPYTTYKNYLMKYI